MVSTQNFSEKSPISKTIPRCLSRLNEKYLPLRPYMYVNNQLGHYSKLGRDLEMTPAGWKNALIFVVKWLTDTVRKVETAEKCHLSNLSNTPQNFCPMMILTIGHKMGQKNCPWVAPGILGSISYEFWRISSFAVNNNQVFWNWLRMLLLDWIFMRKRVFWKFPICLHFWINPSNLTSFQFGQGS